MQRYTLSHSCPDSCPDSDGDISICHWTPEDVAEPSAVAQGAPPPLHWTHANGFNAQTYAPMLAPLAAHFDVYACDLRGHGFTTLMADPDALKNWDVYCDDLIAVLAHLHAKTGQKIWLGGHSMGGYASVYAAALRPDLVAGLVLADPVILPRALYYMRWLWMLLGRSPAKHMAIAARKRRAVWADSASIKKSYTGRGAFTHWQDKFLDSYLAGGLKPHDAGVQLACAPAWEAANYDIWKRDISRHIMRLQVPFTLLLAETGSATRNIAAFEAARVDKVILRVAQSTHFLPMELPAYVQDAFLAYIGKAIEPTQ